jgi:hypothetical protein
MDQNPHELDDAGAFIRWIPIVVPLLAVLLVALTALIDWAVVFSSLPP